MSKKLEEAMTALEHLGRNQSLSETDKDAKIRQQYEYIIHVLVDEVRSLDHTVKSLCADRI